MVNIFSDVKIKEPEQSGTTFYLINLDDVENTYKDENNVVFNYLLREYGFGAFDTSSLIGSGFEGETFVLCVTDGYDIEIDGELVDPELALEDFGYDVLDRNGYVYEDDVPETIIKRYLSYYELADVDLNEVVMDLLSAGHDIYMILRDAADIDLFDTNTL